jgi:hypothetical protein
MSHDLLLVTAGSSDRHDHERVLYELARMANVRVDGKLFPDRELERLSMPLRAIESLCSVRKGRAAELLEDLAEEGALRIEHGKRGRIEGIIVERHFLQQRWQEHVVDRSFGLDGLVRLPERLRTLPRTTNTKRFVLGRHDAWKQNPSRGKSRITHEQVATVVLGDPQLKAKVGRTMRSFRERELVAYRDQVKSTKNGRSRFALFWVAEDEREARASAKARRKRRLDRKNTAGLRRGSVAHQGPPTAGIYEGPQPPVSDESRISTARDCESSVACALDVAASALGAAATPGGLEQQTANTPAAAAGGLPPWIDPETGGFRWAGSYVLGLSRKDGGKRNDNDRRTDRRATSRGGSIEREPVRHAAAARVDAKPLREPAPRGDLRGGPEGLPR